MSGAQPSTYFKSNLRGLTTGLLAPACGELLVSAKADLLLTTPLSPPP